jgi:hypothetical protein
MGILVINQKVTPEQLSQMLEAIRTQMYIKVALDVESGVLAGGGAMHYECEEVLLEAGYPQDTIWGAGWYVNTQQVAYDSLINIRPRQNNRSNEPENPETRARIKDIVEGYFKGVQP